MKLHTLLSGLLYLVSRVGAVQSDDTNSDTPTAVPVMVQKLEENATSQEAQLQKLDKLLKYHCKLIDVATYTTLKVLNSLTLIEMMPGKLKLTQAKQISSYELYGAWRAIDGSKDPDFWAHSCTHTSFSNYRGVWWQAKLVKPSIVYQLRITNRGDCCGQRLANFEIQGFDKDPEVSQTPKICKRFSGQVSEGDTEIITCDKPIKALYLRLMFMAGQVGVLTICEFEAFGNALPENWKALTNAIQSSNTHEEVQSRAWRALDEDPQTCTHTDAEKDNDAWWELDLRQTKTVVSVTLTNRNDDKAKWLQDIEVSVHEQRLSSCTENEAVSSSLCARQEAAVGQAEELTLTCTTPVTGRYLRVTKKRRAGEALSLCEVVVTTED